MTLISIFLLSSFLAYSCNGFIPQIVDSINTAVVSEKGTAYLNCTMVISDDMLTYAAWYRGKQQISKGESTVKPLRQGLYGIDKFEVKFFKGRPGYAPSMDTKNDALRTYQLIARFADAKDSQNIEGMHHEFRCVIEIPSTIRSEWPVAYGKILVKIAPHILPQLTSKIVNEGESLTLTCNSTDTPKPKISWTRANGQPLSLPGFPQRVNNEVLYLPKIFRGDRGVYRCFAVNNVYRSAEYDVMVEVNYKPSVRVARIQGAYGQAPNENYHVSMECIVNGYPDPDLYWYKGVYDPITNNEPLYDDDRYDLEKAKSYGAVGTNITDVFSILLIRNIRDGDYGNYSCRAANSYGSEFAVVNLFYQAICQGAICPMLAAADNTGG